jgi:hypothetical protein
VSMPLTNMLIHETVWHGHKSESPIPSEPDERIERDQTELEQIERKIDAMDYKLSQIKGDFV